MPKLPAAAEGSRRAMLVAVLVAAGAVLAVGGFWPDKSSPIAIDMVPVATSGERALFVSRAEITVTEWSLCHAQGGCSLELRAPDDGQEYPATGVNFVDAQQFIVWINAVSGAGYRLPTKAEWYAMADEVLPETPDPIFTAPELRWASAYLVEAPTVDRALHPTGAFATTSMGLRDLDGNVWEWTQDCYDGDSARTSPANCPAFIMGGLHESVMSFLVRDPASGGCASGLPPAHLGFRLVSDTKP